MTHIKSIQKNRRYVLGIDPSSGSKSACGLALYDRDKDIIIETWGIVRRGPKTPTYLRLKDIVDQVGLIIRKLCIEYQFDIEIHSEWFVMQGKGGETLQRVIGGIICCIPAGVIFKEVHNIKLKKALTGNQKADKADMAEGLLEKIPKSASLINNLISHERWDEVDAACIAWCRDER